MKKIRSLIHSILIGAALISACTSARLPSTPPPAVPASAMTATSFTPTVTATETADPEKEKLVQATIKLCSRIQAGQVCLGEGPVQVEAQTGRKLAPFQKPGQILNLADIQRLKLGDAGSGKGLALLRIQTENHGEFFTVVAFGDVEMVNQVPYGTREFNGMQSMKLTTGPNPEGKPTTSGLLVQASGGDTLSTLVVNGAEMTFGSTAFLTNVAGAMTVQTLAGAVGVSSPLGMIAAVVQGTVWNITEEQLTQGLRANHREFTPQEDDAFHARMIQDALDRYFGTHPNGTEAQFKESDWPKIKRAWRYLGLLPSEPRPYEDPKIRSLMDALKRYMEKRSRQKPWKGGWWSVTPAAMTVSGSCKDQALGVHQTGGSGKNDNKREAPTMEIPICRGNNGNTILMYESGTSYDRIGPNLFASSSVEEMNFPGGSNYITTGSLQTLQVVSPTRMILNETTSESGGCSVATALQLDFVRDDPAVRCGKIIDLSLTSTPVPAKPTPEPQQVDPPVEGEYPVRIGLLKASCDSQAMPYAPDLTAANLSLSPENNLILEASSGHFELEQTGLPFSFFSAKTSTSNHQLGIYTLQQPLADPFSLSMTLMQIPGQQWSGTWQVTNQDGSQQCGGSVDLLMPK